MRSYSSAQNTLAAGNPSLFWLFEIDTSGNGTPDYYYSTAAYTYGGQAYTAVIVDFQGIQQIRPKAENQSIALLEASFAISDTDFSLTPSDFDGATVTIKHIANDGTNEEQMGIWKLKIERAESAYGKITCSCIDLLQYEIQNKFYPKTKLVSALYPDDSNKNRSLCIPIVFGIAYVPLEKVYYSTAARYLIGPSGRTYTVYAIHTPVEYDADFEWVDDGHSGSYNIEDTVATFDTDWKGIQPEITDDDQFAILKQGSQAIPIVCRFSRDDTVSLTSPEEVIEYVVEDLGMDSGDVDTGGGSTFETAGTTYSSTWSLTWSGGWSEQGTAEERIASLLLQCNSTFIMADKLELYILTGTADADVVGDTLDASDLWDFRHSLVTRAGNDSGYIEWQESGEPEDRWNKTLCPAKSSTDNPSSDTLRLNLIHDSQDAQRAGSLYFQKKLMRYADVSATGKYALIKYLPGDVVKINHNFYGGEMNVMFDVVHIYSNGDIKLEATRYS